MGINVINFNKNHLNKSLKRCDSHRNLFIKTAKHGRREGAAVGENRIMCVSRETSSTHLHTSRTKLYVALDMLRAENSN